MREGEPEGVVLVHPVARRVKQLKRWELGRSYADTYSSLFTLHQSSRPQRLSEWTSTSLTRRHLKAYKSKVDKAVNQNDDPDIAGFLAMMFVARASLFI